MSFYTQSAGKIGGVLLYCHDYTCAPPTSTSSATMVDVIQFASSLPSMSEAASGHKSITEQSNVHHYNVTFCFSATHALRNIDSEIQDHHERGTFDLRNHSQ